MMKKTVMLSLILTAYVQASDISGRYYESHQHWLLEIQGTHIDGTMDVNYSGRRFPLWFSHPLSWDDRHSRHETMAFFYTPEGCRYRAFLDFVPINDLENSHLRVTVKVPAQISVYCDAQGLGVGRFFFERE